VIFAGRVGAFRYLNMDDAVLAGMEAARQVLGRLIANTR
jgi:UDP-galactopyranose mutase